MNHGLTLNEVLARFRVVEHNSDSAVTSFSTNGTGIVLHWKLGQTVQYSGFDSAQPVATDGHFFYATDDKGQAFRFCAYTIVNFDEELPPQS